MFLNNYCFYFQNIWILDTMLIQRMVSPIKQIFASFHFPTILLYALAEHFVHHEAGLAQLLPRAASETGVDTLQVVFCYHHCCCSGFCMLDEVLAERKAPFCVSSRGQNLVGFSYTVT